MGSDKQMAFGSAGMLLLKLLEQSDLYGYQMIEELARRSDHTFDLKAGTLYPLLHSLEEQGYVEVVQTEVVDGRARSYYGITDTGRTYLKETLEDYRQISGVFADIMRGGDTNGL